MKEKILVIEDEEEILDNIRILLEAEGYEAIIANNGREGLTKSAETSPDLIICDIMMPDIDGYEVLRQLKTFQNADLIPFIFITAKVDRNDLRKGMELGADDYISKPFSASELLTAIRTRLDKYKIIKGKLLTGRNEENPSPDTKYEQDESIFISYRNSSIPVKIRNIKYITAENQYTKIVLEDNRKFLMRRALSEWEELLPEQLFMRVHRSTIINLNYLTKIAKNTDSIYRVVLRNTDESFEVSRRYIKKIKSRI